MTLSRLLSGLSAIALVLAAACATGPAYKPMGPGETTGYTDTQLAPNRYRVTFTGSSGTSRPDVEDYLLRRAAEVTARAGYPFFTFDTRSMEASTYYRTSFDTWPHTFGPQSWYASSFWYWSSWPYPPMWDGTILPVTRYTAYAEIVMLTADQAASRLEAIPASQVLDHLMPAAPPKGPAS